MESTITIRRRDGVYLFYDDHDRQTFRWVCSLLPHHLANDLLTYEHCAVASHIEMTEREAVVHLQTYDWTSDQCARFICMCYDSYLRRKYQREGKQTCYEIQ